MEFKDKVLQIRMQLNMSQEALARDLEVSYATVNRWENGNSHPRPRQVYAFDKYCQEHDIAFLENTG